MRACVYVCVCVLCVNVVLNTILLLLFNVINISYEHGIVYAYRVPLCVKYIHVHTIIVKKCTISLNILMCQSAINHFRQKEIIANI